VDTATTTRRRILDAALACFLEHGYEHTTVARIRARSGVSNGALFHHFRSKEAISDALYVDAIASFQAGLWDLLRSRPRSLRAAVGGTIAHQLDWVEQNPGVARFVYTRGHLDWGSAGSAQIEELNRELADAFRAWMAPLLDTGELRVTSMLLITAVVNGPAHAIARRWLAGQLGVSPLAFADDLTDAACAALGGRRVRSRRPAAARGRLTLELLADDGQVLAHGHATAALLTQATSAAGDPEPA
jgi:AcrR family transcriptional regulator